MRLRAIPNPLPHPQRLSLASCKLIRCAHVNARERGGGGRPPILGYDYACMGSGRGIRANITKRACVRLTLLLVLLVGGAIVNVAVAWGCIIACWRVERPTTITASEIRDAVAHWSTCPTTDATQWQGDRFVAHGLRVEYHYGGTLTTGGQLLITSAGLPLHGVQGVMKNECGVRSTSGQFNGRRGASVMKTAYPYRPLWPGFAINTVFYSFVLWLLFAAPFALRRRLRVKRGLCPKCAYDLRGHSVIGDVCPECGRGTAATP